MDELWIVRGTLPKNRVGGVAQVKIDRCDGVVVDITHGK
jgi:hypothetical protein